MLVYEFHSSHVPPFALVFLFPTSFVSLFYKRGDRKPRPDIAESACDWLAIIELVSQGVSKSNTKHSQHLRVQFLNLGVRGC